MTKIEIESKILNKRAQIEKIERRLNKHLNNPNADPYDVRSARYDLEQAQNTLTKYMEQLRKAEADESLPEIPVIRNFLDQWEARCIEYHNQEAASYTDAYKLMNEGKFTESLTEEQRARYAFRTYGRVDDYKLFRTWARYNISEFTQNHVCFRTRTIDESGLKEIAKEKDRKYVKFLRQILAIVGNVTEAYLSIGGEGDINGTVIGDNGRASVQTFGAGGYNIQCFHFRTKVTALK